MCAANVLPTNILLAEKANNFTGSDAYCAPVRGLSNLL